MDMINIQKLVQEFADAGNGETISMEVGFNDFAPDRAAYYARMQYDWDARGDMPMLQPNGGDKPLFAFGDSMVEAVAALDALCAK